jgi:hypothetical protein
VNCIEFRFWIIVVVGGHSVRIVRSRTKGHGVCFLFLLLWLEDWLLDDLSDTFFIAYTNSFVQYVQIFWELKLWEHSMPKFNRLVNFLFPSPEMNWWIIIKIIIEICAVHILFMFFLHCLKLEILVCCFNFCSCESVVIRLRNVLVMFSSITV